MEAMLRVQAELLQRGGLIVRAEGEHTVFCQMREAKFSLSFMPGNRRTMISHGAEVDLVSRRHGVGTKMCQLREDVARAAGVTLMLATVMDDNIAQVRVMQKCGWSRFTQNAETKCSLWGKQLQPEKPPALVDIHPRIPEKNAGLYKTGYGYCTGTVGLMVGQYPATPAHGARWVEVTPMMTHLGKPICAACSERFEEDD